VACMGERRGAYRVLVEQLKGKGPLGRHSCRWEENIKMVNLMFAGPCIVIYFYSKTNQMHSISNLFYFGTTLYMFQTVIRSLRLCIQHHTIQILWLLASGFPLASR